MKTKKKKKKRIKTNRVVAYKHGEVTDFDIDEALKMTKELNPFHLEVARMMAR